MVRVALRILAVAMALGLLAGFAGGVHPLGDSFAVLRLPLALGLALVLLGVGGRLWSRGLLILAALLPAVGVWAGNSAISAPSPHDRVLYQQNLLWNRRDDAAWLANVAATQPDFVTLQEVSSRNATLLEALRTDYPHQALCPFANVVGGVAVLSRWPGGDGGIVCAKGLAAMEVSTPQGDLWLVSIHLHWPWPFDQADQVDELVEVLAGLDGPVIIGGDFNAVRWSNAIRRIAAASEARVAGPQGATFRLPYLGVPIGIDHVLSSSLSAGEVIPVAPLGSDHNGVVAYLRYDDL